MALLNDFFYIRELNAEEEGKWVAKVELNPDHRIFEGHFPGQPVVPGVCLMQMSKEVLGEALSKRLLLHHAANIKFLSVVDPRQHSVFHLEVSSAAVDGGVSIRSRGFSGETDFFKLSGTCRVL